MTLSVGHFAVGVVWHRLHKIHHVQQGISRKIKEMSLPRLTLRISNVRTAAGDWVYMVTKMSGFKHSAHVFPIRSRIAHQPSPNILDVQFPFEDKFFVVGVIRIFLEILKPTIIVIILWRVIVIVIVIVSVHASKLSSVKPSRQVE